MIDAPPQPELLAHRLAEARAGFDQAHGPAGLAAALREYAGAPLVCQDHPWLRALLPWWGKDDPEVNFLTPQTPAAPLQPEVDTAVSVGFGAVPETGSLLLGDASFGGWWLSLRPRLHIVVIPAGRAGLTLEEALTLSAAEPSGLVSWITGPSRTADIEKVLVLGAQGAAAVQAVIYHPESGGEEIP